MLSNRSIVVVPGPFAAYGDQGMLGLGVLAPPCYGPFLAIDLGR
jgi:hypothetical protein